MEINELPKLNTNDNPTQCCPRFLPEEWDGKEFVFKDKPFVQATTINVMHMPLTMGSMMKKTWKKITDAHADDKDTFALLSYDPTPWKGEHYFTVTKEVPGTQNVTLSGIYLTKVYEGPYKEAGKFLKDMEKHVRDMGKEVKKIYFYYTTCPKCIKYYKKNYMVAFAQI